MIKKYFYYKVSISLVNKYKKEIEKIEKIEVLKEYLDDVLYKFNNIFYLKYILFIKDFEFNDDFLNINRRKFLLKKKEIWKKENRNKIEKIKLELKNKKELCNRNWPFCLYDPEINYQYNDVLIYSQLNPINIIDDYFSSNNKNLKKNVIYHNNINGNENLNFENILVERKPHYCNDYKKEKNINITENKLEVESSLSNVEENYYEKKKKYKMMKKMKYIKSSYFHTSQKIKNEGYCNNINNFSNDNYDYNCTSNINTFLSNGYISYSKYSLHEYCSLTNLPQKNLLDNP